MNNIIVQDDSIALVVVNFLVMAPRLSTLLIADLHWQSGGEFEMTWLQLAIDPTQQNQIATALQTTIVVMLFL